MSLSRCRDNLRLLFPVLMLLGNYLDSLPLLHHHEKAHTCIEQDGTFFYLITEHSNESTDPLRLTPIHIGKHHEHEICGLCQLLPSLLDCSVLQAYFPVVVGLLSSVVTEFGSTLNAGLYRPRGPPLFS